MEALCLLLHFAAPFGLLRLGTGLDTATRGMRGRRRAESLRRLPWPPRTGALPPLVKASGVVEDTASFRSPITGRRCVLLRYELVPGEGLGWRAALRGTLGSSFYLGTPQGRI